MTITAVGVDSIPLPPIPVQPQTTPIPHPPTQSPRPAAPQDIVDLSAAATSAAVVGSATQTTQAVPPLTHDPAPRPINERAARHAERRAERLIDAADRRLDRLAKRFAGNEDALKTIESLRDAFDTAVADATDKFIDGGAADRTTLRAELSSARKALRAGIHDLLHPMAQPPAAAPTPAPADPAAPPVSPGAPRPQDTTVPVAAAPIDPASVQPGPTPTDLVPTPADPAPMPANSVPADAPTPATLRLILTYRAFTFTFATDKVG